MERLLGYRFKDSQYLTRALTHRSYAGENYERLEFLGDAVLGLVIGAALYERFPDADEGQLSRLRASLVRKETLAELGHELNIGPFLRLGEGEMRSGGQQRGSILADVMESLLGGVYLDGGFAEALALVHRLFHSRLQDLDAAAQAKDPKTRLQEFLQSKNRPLPAYLVEHVKGEQHEQQFFVLCSIEQPRLQTQGQGGSRRKAEQQAASIMLDKLSK
ncbi:MAG: ribonuclease III [gamma proteobacterium symbiont of Bathyaustriella thionipta]|nr:ribonuclease III [gamma proteobacterium symbiont of Bathyaustriella thionipta]